MSLVNKIKQFFHAHMAAEFTADEVTLKEFCPKNSDQFQYTGQQKTFRIGYVLPIDDKRVVFSLLPLEGK